MKVHVWTPLGVETHQFLQSGCFDDVEARLSSEGAGLPINGGADGVSHKAFQGEGSAYLDHALTKYSIRTRFLQHDSRVKLQSIDVPVEFLETFGHFFVVCFDKIKQLEINLQVVLHSYMSNRNQPHEGLYIKTQSTSDCNVL